MKYIVSMVLLIVGLAFQAEGKELDSNLAGKYAIYAMMASNVYLKEDRTYFPIEELGWVKIDINGNPTKENSYTPGWLGRLFSNLQYDIWINKNTNDAVIAFKGTDEKIDWVTGNLSIGISVPYKSAKKHVKKFRDQHPNTNLVLTGHSLGGGLALSVSLWEGIDAFVFNSSPRVFDGIGDHNEPANRKAIYQEEDILQKIREVYPKFLEIISKDNIIQTKFSYGKESNHRGDLIAEGILRCATNSRELKMLADKIPKKISCNF